MLKIFNQTENGRIFKCPNCSKIHFEYKNLNFNFEEMKDFEYTAAYFLKLDGAYWENKNIDSFFTRKILVPIGHHNFHIMLNNDELIELKKLFKIEMDIEERSLDLSNFEFCAN